MNATAKKLALALGMLALTTSCTTTSNSSTQTQHLQKVAEVSNQSKVATAKIKIDASSTVYPMTQAIALAFQSNLARKLTPTSFHQACICFLFWYGDTSLSLTNQFFLK